MLSCFILINLSRCNVLRTTVYLHIGTWKTGTTAIQEFCKINQDYLREHGIVFPDEARAGIQHAPLAWFFGQGYHEKVKSLEGDPWLDLLPYIGEVDKILLSSEMLYRPCVDEDIAGAIKEKLNGAVIKVIVSFRNQIDMSASAYAQLIKRGFSTPPFERWIEEKSSFFYDRQLKQLWKNFGREDVIVRIYDKSSIKGFRNFREFFEILGVEFDEKKLEFPERESNPSLPNNLLELCREANEYSGDVEVNRIRNIFLRDLMLSNGVSSTVGEKLSYSDRKRIFKRYRKSNQKLAKMLGSQYPYVFPDFEDLGDKKNVGNGQQLDSVVGSAVEVIDMMMEKLISSDNK